MSQVAELIDTLTTATSANSRYLAIAQAKTVLWQSANKFTQDKSLAELQLIRDFAAQVEAGLEGIQVAA